MLASLSSNAVSAKARGMHGKSLTNNNFMFGQDWMCFVTFAEPIKTVVEDPIPVTPVEADKELVAQIMEELPEKERTLIRMRYFEERTQTDIAAKLGISQVQVSRMEKKILASMKKKLA